MTYENNKRNSIIIVVGIIVPSFTSINLGHWVALPDDTPAARPLTGFCGWLIVLRFNATLTAKVISWRSVSHMCFLAFSHQH